MSEDVPELDDPRVLRNVMLGDTGYRLFTWEGEGRFDTGQLKVCFAFYEPDEDEPLFRDVMGCSPAHAIDSDGCLRSIMGFVTLRPGDTDPGYFDDYTERQREWAETQAEDLTLWSLDQNDEALEGSEDYALFVDIENDVTSGGAA